MKMNEIRARNGYRTDRTSRHVPEERSVREMQNKRLERKESQIISFEVYYC